MKTLSLLFCLLSLGACASAPPPSAPPPAAAASASMPPAPPADLALPMDAREVAFREEAETARSQGHPIRIDERSYAGGRFEVAFYNVSGRVFQNMTFQLQPYDATGRLAGPIRAANFRGPVAPSLTQANHLLRAVEDGVWNDPLIACVEIAGLGITYEGGETRGYNFEAVSRMYRGQAEKWCRIGG